MKFVLFTDPHLGRKQNNKKSLDLSLELCDDMINCCFERQIKKIVCLGDWFDNRKTLNVLTIATSLEFCMKITSAGIDLYIIKGNHDQFYKTEPNPHSLQHLKSIEGVHIIDDIFYLDNEHCLIPWGYDTNLIKNHNVNLFAHLEINGFKQNYTERLFDGGTLNASDFKHFKNVFSGHFHTVSKNGNVTYIGSPYAMTFNDQNSERGYYVYTDGKLEFIEFTKAPKYIVISDPEEIKEDVIKGNIVKFIFKEDYGAVKSDEILQQINSFFPLELYRKYDIPVNDELQLDEDIVDISDNSVVFREFLTKKELPKHINKKTLFKLIGKLEKEF